MMQTKREPTPLEVAVLECAKAIDRMELALTEQERALDRALTMLETIDARDAWIDDYRAHERDGLPEI